MSYEPTLSDAVEGSRYCLADDCGIGNPWLHGERPPVICRGCDRHLACVECGTCTALDDAGKCELCADPVLTICDAEFGLRFERRSVFVAGSDEMREEREEGGSVDG